MKLSISSLLTTATSLSVILLPLTGTVHASMNPHHNRIRNLLQQRDAASPSSPASSPGAGTPTTSVDLAATVTDGSNTGGTTTAPSVSPDAPGFSTPASAPAAIPTSGAGAAPPNGKLANVYTKCVRAKTAAITFDDGPYDYIQNISDTLTAAGVKGTFFMNGNNARCIYSPASQERVKYVYAAGHQIASHTWAHLDLTKLPWDVLVSEMKKTDEAIHRLTGAVPAMVRPPFGIYNDTVRQAAATRGQSVIVWDFDDGDAVGLSANASMQRYEDVPNAKPSNTLLTVNHETHETTATQVLPYAISALKRKGYKLVTVAECLGKAAYRSVGPAPDPDPSWWC